MKIGEIHEKCGTAVTRRADSFYWRGTNYDAAYCETCNSIWPIDGEEMPPLGQLKQRTNKATKMTEKREGPYVSYTCCGCRYHEQEHFRVQGDSGYSHYCTHGDERRHANTYSDKTPDWCPYIPTNQ